MASLTAAARHLANDTLSLMSFPADALASSFVTAVSDVIVNCGRITDDNGTSYVHASFTSSSASTTGNGNCSASASGERGGGGDDNVTAETLGADVKAFESVVQIVVPIIFGFIATLGFVGNLLVIIVVVSNKQMRNTTNALIINLAIADLVFIVVCVPFTAVTYAIPVWPFGSVFCKIYQYVIHVTAHASVYTLVLMSLDRYLAVVHPIRSMTVRTEQNAWIACAAAWTIICAVNAPMLAEFDVYAYEVGVDDLRSTCMNLKLLAGDEHGRVFYGCFFAFAYVLPLSLVTVLYGFMIRRLLTGNAATAASASGGSRRAEGQRARRRVTRMVVVVVVIFGACWLPLHVIFIVQFFGTYPDTVLFIAVKIASCCLAYMNSCVNPILYAFLSENFRKSFRRLLGCVDSFQPLKVEIERTSVRPCEAAAAAAVAAATARSALATTTTALLPVQAAAAHGADNGNVNDTYL